MDLYQNALQIRIFTNLSTDLSMFFIVYELVVGFTQQVTDINYILEYEIILQYDESSLSRRLAAPPKFASFY